MRLTMAQASSRSRTRISAQRSRIDAVTIVDARQRRQQRVDLARHRVDVGGVGAQQDRLRDLVVLGLREQVHRDPAAGAVPSATTRISDGPAIMSMPTVPNTRRFAAATYALPGPTILSTAGTVAVPYASARDRLRAADREHAVDAGDRGRREHHRVARAVRRRRDHHDLADAGDLRGNRVHQHARRIRGEAARHVDADAIERRDALAEPRAVGLVVGPRSRPRWRSWKLRTRAAACSSASRCVGRQRVARRVEFAARGISRSAADATVDAIEAARVVDERGVAAPADVGDDRAPPPGRRPSRRRCRSAAARRARRRSRRRACRAAGPSGGCRPLVVSHAALRSFARDATARSSASSSGVDRLALQLHRGLVDDQPRRDRHDRLDLDQVVRGERRAGRHEVDDRVRQADQRAELHRAVQLDQVDVHALHVEVLARRLHVLRRDRQPRAVAHRVRVVEAARRGDRHPAARDAEVERRIQPRRRRVRAARRVRRRRGRPRRTRRRSARRTRGR